MRLKKISILFIIALIIIYTGSLLTAAEGNSQIKITEYKAAEQIGTESVPNLLAEWPDRYNYLQTITAEDGGISVLNTNLDSAENFFIYEFDKNAEFRNKISFKSELPVVCAFTKDKNGNYYIAYGKGVNDNEKEATNLIIAKYDLNGKKLCLYSNTAIDTYEIWSKDYRGVKSVLNSGAFRMEISGDMLAVYFARLMFKSPDNLNHQASYGILLGTENLTAISGRENNRYMPTAGHSFDQLIYPIEDGFIFVDKGDNGPRGYLVSQIKKDTPEIKSLTFMNFKKGSVYQSVFSDLGGIAETEDGYMIMGTYEKNNITSAKFNDNKNIFISLIKKDFSTDVNTIWLTDYKNDIKNQIIYPKLIKTGSDKFVLIWETADTEKYEITGAYMMIINGKGEKIKDTVKLRDISLPPYDILRYNSASARINWAVKGGDNTVWIYSFNPEDPDTIITTKTTTDISQKIAKKTKSSVYINGKKTEFDAYFIDGNNYFKLRDLAFALNGTEKQFDIGYDVLSKTIALTTKTPYSIYGGEMRITDDNAEKTAKISKSSLFCDSKLLDVTAYMIENNNYFKLRDLAAIINFGVIYDPATRSINIDTSKNYVP